MSQSDELRTRISTVQNDGVKIFNEAARKLESSLSYQTKNILIYLKNKYKNHDVTFYLKPSLTKIEISCKVVDGYKPSNDRSTVKPDGGILYAQIGDIHYPILVSEAKKQGTNDIRNAEGKKKQAAGNAIERACKNILEFLIYFDNYDYFPYIVFIYGCDFGVGSSINDRLDSMTRYKPRNELYIFDEIKKASVFVQVEPYGDTFIFNTLKTVVDQIMEKLIHDKNER